MHFNPWYRLVIFLILFSVQRVSAQGAQSGENSLQFYLDVLEKREKVKFFYKAEWIENVYPERALESAALNVFLEEGLKGSGLQYYFLNGARKVILLPAGHRNKPIEPVSPGESFVPDGKTYTIAGIISDANTGASIAGATIWIEELNTGTVTNSGGHFSITLPSARYTLETRQVGKEAERATVYLRSDTTLRISLFDNHVQLQTVTISGETMDMNLSSAGMSIVKMNANTMKLIPPMLGEVDIIKSLTSLPGVSTVGEGAGGFNVRGGNADQNLILLDDAPLFNSSHLFGFVSVFNPDVVDNVTLYKGALPASLGGRISSVLEVSTMDANKKNLSLSGGVGTISSRLSIEVPLIKDKTSVLVGGRYAYPNWLLRKIKDLNVRSSAAQFHDLNMKVSHRLNSKNDLELSLYQTSDDFKFAEDTVYAWQSVASSFRWNSILAEKFLVKAVGFYSDYRYSISGNKPSTEFTADFGIKTYGLKSDLSYSFNADNFFDLGFSVNFYESSPGTLSPRNASSINGNALEKEQGRETAAYLGFESRLNSFITWSSGLRVSFYSAFGPDEVYIYEPGAPRSEFTVSDTLHIASSEPVRNYWGLEPRISASISTGQSSSVKVSYNRTIQYIHLISNSTAINPMDLWQLSNYHIEPQASSQFAVGYFRNFVKKGLETSVELYYRTIDNVPDYKDGAELFLNPTLETAILPVSGTAYGAEWFVKRHTGRLTGWLSYTYSRSLRQANDNLHEAINDGKYYPASFDKPHSLSVLANYKLTRRLSLSGSLSYSTGRPVTYPSAVYLVDEKPVAHFAARNNARVPDYHRLDVSITLAEGLRHKRKFRGSWILSVMNVYGRKNAYSVFFKPNEYGREIQAYKLSVIGTMIPALTYNFRF